MDAPSIPTLPSATETDERRRDQLAADLALTLAWIRSAIGPSRWQAISQRMALLTGSSADQIASSVSSAVMDLEPETQRILIGMFDELLDDLVVGRPHRPLFVTETAALEALREALARV